MTTNSGTGPDYRGERIAAKVKYRLTVNQKMHGVGSFAGTETMPESNLISGQLRLLRGYLEIGCAYTLQLEDESNWPFLATAFDENTRNYRAIYAAPPTLDQEGL